MTGSGWFWLIVAASVFWAVGAYRRLMGLRAQVRQRFAVLEEWMLRYQSLVQEATTAAVTFPADWRAATAPEVGAGHWTRLQVAANHSAMALAHMQEHPLEPLSASALLDAHHELQQAWEELTHPDVCDVRVPQEMTQRWRELGIALQPDWNRFNQAVTDYNDAIALFPGNLMARLLGFKPGRMLA